MSRTLNKLRRVCRTYLDVLSRLALLLLLHLSVLHYAPAAVTLPPPSLAWVLFSLRCCARVCCLLLSLLVPHLVFENLSVFGGQGGPNCIHRLDAALLGVCALPQAGQGQLSFGQSIGVHAAACLESG